jgi:hypothetical protein
MVELHAAAKAASEYLEALCGMEKALRNLHAVATDSLINGDLDETAKGHRLGTIEVCEAVLKIF